MSQGLSINIPLSDMFNSVIDMIIVDRKRMKYTVAVLLGKKREKIAKSSCIMPRNVVTEYMR